MATNLIFAELSYRIIGVCFDVHNEIGGGHKEKIYQKAVGKGLQRCGISFQEQLNAPLVYEDIVVGRFILDFLVDNRIVLELKVGSRFRNQDYNQVKQYLIRFNLPLGILVRFDGDSVIHHRILNPNNKPAYP